MNSWTDARRLAPAMTRRMRALNSLRYVGENLGARLGKVKVPPPQPFIRYEPPIQNC